MSRPRDVDIDAVNDPGKNGGFGGVGVKKLQFAQVAKLDVTFPTNS